MPYPEPGRVQWVPQGGSFWEQIRNVVTPLTEGWTGDIDSHVRRIEGGLRASVVLSGAAAAFSLLALLRK